MRPCRSESATIQLLQSSRKPEKDRHAPESAEPKRSRSQDQDERFHRQEKAATSDCRISMVQDERNQMQDDDAALPTKLREARSYGHKGPGLLEQGQGTSQEDGYSTDALASVPDCCRPAAAMPLRHMLQAKKRPCQTVGLPSTWTSIQMRAHPRGRFR